MPISFLSPSECWPEYAAPQPNTIGTGFQAEIATLARFSNSWAYRAAVKKPDLEPNTLFDQAKPDYLVELLPFHDHPDFLNAPREFQQLALSCGWLAYNEKTIAIESKVVNPACMHVIDGDIPGLAEEIYRRTASQALVDESYHILLIVKTCAVTRLQRNLNGLRIPQFELIRELWKYQEEHSEHWKKIVIQLAIAVVSEVLVSDYLRLLSTANSIQPLHMVTTEIHRRDEAAHNAIFKKLGAAIFRCLGIQERALFLQVLPKASRWFASTELDVWKSMLRQIEFPNGDRIIEDCRLEVCASDIHLDLTTLESLYEELNVNPAQIIDV